jgi:hypothetical protein
VTPPTVLVRSFVEFRVASTSRSSPAAAVTAASVNPEAPAASAVVAVPNGLPVPVRPEMSAAAPERHAVPVHENVHVPESAGERL